VAASKVLGDLGKACPQSTSGLRPHSKEHVMRFAPRLVPALVGLFLTVLCLLCPAPASARVYVDLANGETIDTEGDYTLTQAAYWVYVTGTSTLNIADGAYIAPTGDTMWFGEGGTINMTGGFLGNDLSGSAGTTFNMSGGVASGIAAATIRMSGGTVTNWVEAWESLTMTGGSTGQASINYISYFSGVRPVGLISGGSIRWSTPNACVWARGGDMVITGGEFPATSTLVTWEGGTITVHGSGLAVGGPSGQASGFPVGWTQAPLTGTLADGHALNGYFVNDAAGSGSISLVNAPPPPPATPEAAAEEIAAAIETLIGGGEIGAGDGKSLTTQLSQATQRFSSGNTGAAVNVMNAFKNKVRALVNSGRLSAGNGQALVDAADEVIALTGS
jgi:hypothetical protein